MSKAKVPRKVMVESAARTNESTFEFLKRSNHPERKSKSQWIEEWLYNLRLLQMSLRIHT